MKTKINKENIQAWFEGHYRYRLYYSKMFGFLIRKHIREQIDFRIRFMDKECYNDGSCKICGCTTTVLQCANKPCDKPCYPTMMSSRKWNSFKEGNLIFVDANGIWEYFPPIELDAVKTIYGDVASTYTNEELVFITKEAKFDDYFARKIKDNNSNGISEAYVPNILIKPKTIK